MSRWYRVSVDKRQCQHVLVHAEDSNDAEAKVLRSLKEDDSFMRPQFTEYCCKVYDDYTIPENELTGWNIDKWDLEVE